MDKFIGSKMAGVKIARYFQVTILAEIRRRIGLVRRLPRDPAG